MKSQDMTFSFTVDQTPEQVFAAIGRPGDWWPGEIKGEADRLGGEFTYRYKDMHRSTQKVTECVPGKRMVWHVTESYLGFLQDKDEWTGTDIVFEISRKGGKTELKFTHVGLHPEVECYDACLQGWGYIIQESLPAFITSGKVAREFNEDDKAA